MQRHPKFDLWLDDDAELAAVIGSPITGRSTLQEWPLSCVQRVECASGRTYVYKVQAEPTVEPLFYERARSPLLVGARVLPRTAMPAALILEDVHAPRLCDLQTPTHHLLSIVDDLVAKIGQISGELPALFDIRSVDLWQVRAATILADLRALIEPGTQPQLTPALVDLVARHCQSAEILGAFRLPMGYVHADLSAGNVLAMGDGYRVLDWQRPIWGPIALDRATLLESLRLGGGPHASVGVLQLRRLLLIGWFAEQARRWFPPGAQWLASEIARVAAQLEHSNLL